MPAISAGMVPALRLPLPPQHPPRMRCRAPNKALPHGHTRGTWWCLEEALPLPVESQGSQIKQNSAQTLKPLPC